jgi:hypothetical protein
LPPGWVAASDPISGNPYYANPSTGQTSWDPPPAPPVRASLQPNAFLNHVTPTINTNGLLIPSARSILSNSVGDVPPNADLNDSHGQNPTPVELQMRAGMIADLATIQSDHRREQGLIAYPYEPLKPFDLPIYSSVEQPAETRLEVRFMSLMGTLETITDEKL